jgi:magnesium transporter
MIKSYSIENRLIVEAPPEDAALRIFICENEEDRKRTDDELKLDRHDVDSALDPEEVPRIEFDEDWMYIIWKRPLNVTFDQRLRFDVASIGILMEAGRLSIITDSDDITFPQKVYRNVESTTDVLLWLLHSIIRHYMEHLKGIKQITTELQSKINKSMDNTYLLQMFALSESLTYYMNAIESNELVLTKLHVNAKKVGISDRQLDLLDDIRLDNQQCARQAEIYSAVLSGLMDARGSIINNNMTSLLRDLTLLNVIFLPLNLIAGIGGMSEFSMMTTGTDWRISYGFFVTGILTLGLLLWAVLTRLLRRR